MNIRLIAFISANLVCSFFFSINDPKRGIRARKAFERKQRKEERLAKNRAKKLESRKAQMTKLQERLRKYDAEQGEAVEDWEMDIEDDEREKEKKSKRPKLTHKGIGLHKGKILTFI